MFLCDDCHQVKRHFIIFRSLSVCENCRRIKDCIDCKDANCMRREVSTEYKKYSNEFPNNDPRD